MSYIYDLADTWNNAGTTFTAIKMNVTDTASNAASLLLDLQVGGSSKFKVSKAGNLTLASNSIVDGPIDYSNGTTLVRLQSSYISFKISGGNTIDLNSGYADAGAFSITNNYALAWGSNNGSQPDLRLFRDAANILAQRNSTNAQTFRVYGTYTNASLYERGAIYADSNGLNIAHEQQSATKRPVRILGHSLASSESVSALELLQTWNTTGTPTALKLNVTDTASNAASLLMDLQIGGSSKFKVTKGGRLICDTPNDGSNFLAHSSGYGIGYYAGGLTLGSPTLYISPGVASVHSTAALGWASSGWSGTIDVALYRDAANILAQRNGTNAQAFRLYNTYTDASNYERGEMTWDTNQLKIGTFKAGTGATRILAVYVGNIRQLISDGSYVQCDTDFYPQQNIIGAAKYQQWTEMTAPAAPSANQVRIYAEDNGSGKTRLMARFNTGAAQQIAIEP